MEIISRKEAKTKGLKWYFTGKPCPRGHICEKMVSNKRCRECNKIKNREYYHANRERLIESHKEWENKNRQKQRDYAKALYYKHIVNRRAKCREYMRKKRENPKHRMSSNLSRQIYQSMKSLSGVLKNYTKWEKLVKFTFLELIEHLEKQFRDGMTWENYGPYWHLDHIKPLSKCSSFEEAWELSNLQPLLAFENLSKNNKWEESNTETI